MAALVLVAVDLAADADEAVDDVDLLLLQALVEAARTTAVDATPMVTIVGNFIMAIPSAGHSMCLNALPMQTKQCAWPSSANGARGELHGGNQRVLRLAAQDS